MRVKLADHNARRLELDYPDEHGRARLVEVEYLTDASGVIESLPPVVRLRPLTIKECQVSGLDWHLREGRVALGTPATLAILSMEGSYTSNPGARWPYEGSISVANLDAERVGIELPTRRLSLDVRAEGAAVTMSESEGGYASFQELVLRNLQTAVGEALLRVGAATGQKTRVSWGGDVPLIDTSAASLRNLVIQKRDFEIEIDQVELPRGITIRGDRIEAREVVVGRTQLVVHDLYALATGRSADAPADREEESAPATFRSLDPKFLDRLHGELDVDLTVDATMPVIGRRRATHHFRVPIEHGTINYRELERDLARLEDAVIDFELRNGHLVLERDVPIIPGLHKPLVLWPLNDVEIGLAKKKIVRLRSLLAYELPEKPEESAEEKSRVSFRRLDFDNIGVAVALLGAADDAPESQVSLSGPVPRATLDDLRVAGFVRHCFTGEPESGAINVTAGGLDATVESLRLGGVSLGAASLRIDAIEDASLTFDGLRPRRLSTVIRGLRLTEASLNL